MGFFFVVVVFKFNIFLGLLTFPGLQNTAALLIVKYILKNIASKPTILFLSHSWANLKEGIICWKWNCGLHHHYKDPHT